MASAIYRDASKQPLVLNLITTDVVLLFDYQKYGGGERDRTDDPLLAKQVLSQLSYTPTGTTIFGGSGWTRTSDPCLIKTVL